MPGSRCATEFYFGEGYQHDGEHRQHHGEQDSDNSYADLSYPDADEMLVKAKLAHEIAQIIKSRHLTQQRAAELLGMPQPKLAEMRRGKYRGISQARMIECLNRLGRDVDCRKKRRPTHTWPDPRGGELLRLPSVS